MRRRYVAPVLVTTLALLASSCTGDTAKSANGTTGSSGESTEQVATETTPKRNKESAASYNKQFPTNEELEIRRADGQLVKVPVRRIKPVVPKVPNPPRAYDPGGNDDDRGRALAEATKVGGQRGEAAWRTVYDLAQVPVLDRKGTALGSTGDDTFGPSFAEVWMTADASDSSGVPLTDAIALVTSPSEPLPPELKSELAERFLQDVRTLRNSSRSSDRTLSSFLDAKVNLPSGITSLSARLLDPAQVSVDAATLQLLNWMLNRAVVRDAISDVASELPAALVPKDSQVTAVATATAVAAGTTATAAGVSRLVAGRGFSVAFQTPAVPASPGVPFNCSAVFSEDGVTNSAVVLVLQKAFGGQQLLGGESGIDVFGGFVGWLKGRIEANTGSQLLEMDKLRALMAELPGIKGSDLAGYIESHPTLVSRISAIAATVEKVGLATAAISLILQVRAMKVSTKPPADIPVLRRGGSPVTQELYLYVDAGLLADGNEKAMCGVNIISSVLGAGFAAPAAGPLSGVEVRLSGKRGFSRDRSGQFVLWDDIAPERGMNTDSNGFVRPVVRSKSGPSSYSEGTLTTRKTYSVKVEAQPEPVTAMTLASIFLDGLTFMNPASWVSGTINVLKTTHFDLGTLEFPFDETSPALSLKIQGGMLGEMSGLFCQGLDGKSTLQGEVTNVELIEDVAKRQPGRVEGQFRETLNLSEVGSGLFFLEKGSGGQWQFRISGLRSPVGRSPRRYRDSAEAWRVSSAVAQCDALVSPPNISPELQAQIDALGGQPGSVNAVTTTGTK
jgi:hypothetical protein